MPGPPVKPPVMASAPLSTGFDCLYGFAEQIPVVVRFHGHGGDGADVGVLFVPDLIGVDKILPRVLLDNARDHVGKAAGERFPLVVGHLGPGPELVAPFPIGLVGEDKDDLEPGARIAFNVGRVAVVGGLNILRAGVIGYAVTEPHPTKTFEERGFGRAQRVAGVEVDPGDVERDRNFGRFGDGAVMLLQEPRRGIALNPVDGFYAQPLVLLADLAAG